MYEDLVSLYEGISIARLALLTAPFVAFTIYLTVVLCGIRPYQMWGKSLNLLAFGAGWAYCGLACLSAYPLNRFMLLPFLEITALYGALIFTIQHPAGCRGAITITSKLGRFLQRFPVFFTILFIIILQLPPLFYGFDVTDAGYHLSQGTLVFHEGLQHADLSNYLFLTCYFSGAVTALLQYFDIGLMGLRLAWLGFFIVPFAVSIHIIRKVMGPHWLLPFFGLAAAASCPIISTILEYQTVPSFFAAIFLYFLYRTYHGGISFRPYWAIGFGIAFFLVLLARVTALPLLLVFLAPILAARQLPIRKNLGFQFMGFGAAFIIFILMLKQANVFSAFFHFKNPTDEHSVSGILAVNFNQIYQFFALQSLGVVFTLTLLIGLAFYLRQTFLYVVLLVALMILCAFPLYWGHPLMPTTLPFIVTATVLIITYALHRSHPIPYPRFAINILVLAAIILPIAMDVGSYDGLTKLGCGTWLLVPLSLMFLLTIAQREEDAIIRMNINNLVVILTIVLVISGFRSFQRYPYGDHYDRRQMTAVFDHPQLAGIHTTPGRKESFEGLITAIAREMPSQSDRLLANNNIPMVFYASHTYPLFDHAWLTCLTVALNQKVANDVCTSPENTPGLILRTKVETRSGDWGNNPQGPPIVEDIFKAKSKLETLDQGVKKCNAKVVWENHDFQLLKPALFITTNTP